MPAGTIMGTAEVWWENLLLWRLVRRPPRSSRRRESFLALERFPTCPAIGASPRWLMGVVGAASTAGSSHGAKKNSRLTGRVAKRLSAD
jgi:hypothetical protein